MVQLIRIPNCHRMVCVRGTSTIGMRIFGLSKIPEIFDVAEEYILVGCCIVFVAF